MFELKICGIYEASRWIANGWPTHVISMVDPGVNVPKGTAKHLIMEMHDVESQLRNTWVVPKQEHLDQILEFGKDLGPHDKLLVHCHQGISRSTAAAIAILMQHGMDGKTAYQHVENIRDVLLPNGKIIRLLDEHMNLGGSLLDLIMSERKDKMKRHMDQAMLKVTHSDVVELKSILEKLNKIV